MQWDSYTYVRPCKNFRPRVVCHFTPCLRWVLLPKQYLRPIQLLATKFNSKACCSKKRKRRRKWTAKLLSLDVAITWWLQTWILNYVVFASQAELSVNSNTHSIDEPTHLGNIRPEMPCLTPQEKQGTQGLRVVWLMRKWETKIDWSLA